ncbi:DUF554 domain-containing protein [Selenomonas bovis]|uniref:DUF554 domain-containing protein n=1 Tax=Selenomonas bovis TaxID=416586 RepID=UPI003CFCD69F
MNLFPGVGVLANVAGIVAGGCAGLVFGRFLTERLQQTLTAACAVAVMFLGLGGALSEALSLSADGRLVFSGSGMLLASMIGGALIGETVNLEDRMEQFGRFLRRRTRSQGDPRFVEGFVTASLTVCIGAMAVIVMVMTASLGKGCVFSALSVGLFQGSIFFAAGFFAPLMTPAALDALNYVGSLLIFCVGTNLLGLTRIRVANLLPSLVVAVAWALA